MWVPSLRKDGAELQVQYAAHPEVVTGRRLLLLVVLRAGPARRRVDDHAGPPNAEEALSEREREIVHLVALGRSSPEIGDELHISKNTVRTHVRNAMAKLNARSRPQLVAVALGHGLIAR